MPDNIFGSAMNATPETSYTQALEKIVSRDADCIPPLRIREYERFGMRTCVLVGKLQDKLQKNGQTLPAGAGVRSDDKDEDRVWMVPQSSIGKEPAYQHKFCTFDGDGKATPVRFTAIHFDYDILSCHIFYTFAARCKWPDIAVRLNECRKWMLFVWEVVIGQRLPGGTKSTPKRKRSESEEEIESEDASSKPSKLKESSKMSPCMRPVVQVQSSMDAAVELGNNMRKLEDDYEVERARIESRFC